MNKLWLWFRLLIGCRCSLFVAGLMIVSTGVVPVVWAFTVVPVVRAADPSGYWETLGALLAYTAVCTAAAACWIGAWSAFCCAASIPGNRCDDSHPASATDIDKLDAEIQTGWLASMKYGGSTVTPEMAAYEKYVAKHEARRTARWRKLRDCDTGIEFAKNLYAILAVVLFPPALLGVIPLILVRTSTYGAAFGLGCAFAGIYIGSAIAMFIVPFAVYGVAWVARRVVVSIWDHCADAYGRAAAVADGFAPTSV